MLLYFIIYLNFLLGQINFVLIIFKKESIYMEIKVNNYLKTHKKDKDLTKEKGNIECGLDWRKAPLKKWDLSGLKLSDYKKRAKFQFATLIDAHLIKTTLKKAFLLGAELQGAKLMGAKLQGAELVGANLQGADLSNSNLRNAIFSEKTILTNVNFFQCTLDGSTIKNAYNNMDKEVIQVRTIKKKRNYSSAREIYILFKKYFKSEGMYDISGKYFVQEKKMERILNKKRKEWGKYFLNTFLDIVSGYGEKPLNAIICSLIIIMGGTNIYWLFDGIMVTNNKVTFSGTFFESFYFSLITFSTLGYGDLIPKAGIFRIIASFESLMGVALTAIFIFIFARKTTR